MEPPPIRAELRIQTICMATLTVVAVGFALDWLEPVMIPFVVSAFLAFALMPLVNVLEKYVRLSRTVSACVALLLAIVVLVGIGALVSVSVDQITSNEKIKPYFQQPLSFSLGELLPKTIFGMNVQDLLADLKGLDSNIPNLLLQITNSVAGVISKSVLVLIFLFFLLLSSVKRDHPIGGAWGEVEAQIRAYLVTMTTLSAVTGALVWAVLSIIGVPAALLFGLLTFLLNFIPNVGSFISILLPIPIILTTGLSPTEKGLAIVLPGVIQFVIGNFVQPNVMGNSMKLHPVVILMALIFWGMLWGIVGMFFAVPITSIIRIVCDRHDLTRPVADLMAGNLDSLRTDTIPPAVAVEEAPTT
jgi:AI-2 transport protein TqsA